jgi:hypothetical protein
MSSIAKVTAPQRVGLGLLAFFYGELVAVPFFLLAVLLRFPSNWTALVHHTRFVLLYLATVAAFEGLTAAITWFVFGSAMVALWLPQRMRQQVGLVYAAALPLALLAPSLLALALIHIHAAQKQFPLMSTPLFVETFGFMLVSSAVALHRYLKMSSQAEELVAKGAKFEF